MSLLIRLNKYFIAAYDAEVAAIDADEEPELPPFPWKELREGVDAGCVNALVDLTVQVVRSVLDWVTHLRLPESLSRSLRTSKLLPFYLVFCCSV